MGIEIDFLPVGEKSSGGDAIALRYGDLHGSREAQTVVVIDGGYRDSGEALVDHITTHYNTDYVDFVISTHPDRDHISGLEVVLEQLKVGRLLMHLPWNHSDAVAESRRGGFRSLAANEKLEKSFQEMSDLEAIANAKDIPISEPFAGVHTEDGCLRVLGPSQDYYEELLPGIITPTSLTRQIAEALVKAGQAVRAAFSTETLDKETLRDDGETRPSNNSSVITLLQDGDFTALLTGDAGIPALERAAAFLESEGFVPGSLNFVQIPHHGSWRNVGPTVLNRLLGRPAKETTHAVAFVSAPPENPDAKHPAKKVTNAFIRRGYAVHATQGFTKWHRRNAPERVNYSNSTPIPFHERVEEDSEA